MTECPGQIWDDCPTRLQLAAERDAARAELREFQAALTRALNEHGVPAMPSWQAAVDYLARTSS